MALVVSSVLTETKSLLNDPIGSIYPDVSLLPLLRKSYTELQTKLSAMGSPVIKEASLPVTVTPGTKLLGDGAGLPTGLILPLELRERALGSTDSYVPMNEEPWEPDEKPTETLRCWAWREETIHLIGCTTPRDVLIRFKKSLSEIVDATSPILINNSQTWLAQRTASMAALLIGSNPNRAAALMTDLNAQNGPWEDLKSTLVHRMQGIPVRRRRTRWRKR